MSEFWKNSTGASSPLSSNLDFGGSDTGHLSLSSGNDFDIELDFNQVPSNVGAGFQGNIEPGTTRNLLNFHSLPDLHGNYTGMPLVASVSCGHQPPCQSKDQHIAALEEYIKRLEAAIGSKNAHLAEYRWLRERFNKLVEAYQALADVRLAAEVSVPASTTLAVLPRPERKQHPRVLYWKRSDWTASPASSKVPTVRGLEGKQVHKILPFLQDADGNVADWDRLTAMRATIRAHWAHMASKKLAPARWGDVAFKPLHDLRVAMYNMYVELTLCDDDWKLHWLCTEGYSSWYSNRKEQLLSIKQEVESDVDHNADDHTSNTAGSSAGVTSGALRKRTAADDGASAPPAKRLQAHHQGDPAASRKRTAADDGASAPPAKQLQAHHQGDPARRRVSTHVDSKATATAHAAQASAQVPPHARVHSPVQARPQAQAVPQLQTPLETQAAPPLQAPVPSAVPSSQTVLQAGSATGSQIAADTATPMVQIAADAATPTVRPVRAPGVEQIVDPERPPCESSSEDDARPSLDEPDVLEHVPPKEKTTTIRNPLSKYVGLPVERGNAQARAASRLEVIKNLAQQIQSDPSSVPGLAPPAATKKKAGQATKPIDRSAKVARPRANVTAPDLMCKLDWWEAHRDDTEGDWQDYWSALPAEEVEKWNVKSLEKKAANAAKKRTAPAQAGRSAVHACARALRKALRAQQCQPYKYPGPFGRDWDAALPAQGAHVQSPEVLSTRSSAEPIAPDVHGHSSPLSPEVTRATLTYSDVPLEEASDSEPAYPFVLVNDPNVPLRRGGILLAPYLGLVPDGGEKASQAPAGTSSTSHTTNQRPRASGASVRDGSINQGSVDIHSTSDATNQRPCVSDTAVRYGSIQKLL
ncbi:hypothetical protein AURDEDRAFT_175559 [Auricularia subglabra TFB-10046 SS5]|uniref:Uncharacterized protein n=1 Tax=Auricularia subglabra (strain TFB-10046 / SS5) TaxID=717982 RepID=J0D841_AURST|nr:hypothetical protein AURDEDRAFT_175559 [Auricularia subglabra TFB-10046 SS5]